MLLIIDGDVMAYHACTKRPAPVDPFLNVLSDIDEPPQEDVQENPYTEAEDEAYKQTVWRNFKRNLEQIKENFFTNNYVMAMKGVGNYRDDLYCDYKKQRSTNKHQANLRPFVTYIRKRAVEEGMATFAHGREADDLIRIWSNEAKAIGQDFIIVSVDKDLLCIPGKHYVIDKKDMRSSKLVVMSELEACRHYYEQLIKGDMTDNIPGVIGIGPKKAESLLKNCTSEEEMQEVAVGLYYSVYGDEWMNQLLSNGKMIHIQNSYDDYFRCSHWKVCQ